MGQAIKVKSYRSVEDAKVGVMLPFRAENGAVQTFFISADEWDRISKQVDSQKGRL